MLINLYLWSLCNIIVTVFKQYYSAVDSKGERGQDTLGREARQPYGQHRCYFIYCCLCVLLILMFIYLLVKLVPLTLDSFVIGSTHRNLTLELFL